MISRGIPHLGLKDPAVIGKVLASEQPERSSVVTTDEIWDIVVRYWDTNPVNQRSIYTSPVNAGQLIQFLVCNTISLFHGKRGIQAS